MYANLEVGIRCKALDAPDEFPESVSAYGIEIRDGVAVVMLDDPDDTGSYAAPAGEQRIDLTKFDLSIAADF